MSMILMAFARRPCIGPAKVSPVLTIRRERPARYHCSSMCAQECSGVSMPLNAAQVTLHIVQRYPHLTPVPAPKEPGEIIVQSSTQLHAEQRTCWAAHVGAVIFRVPFTSG